MFAAAPRIVPLIALWLVAACRGGEDARPARAAAGSAAGSASGSVAVAVAASTWYRATVGEGSQEVPFFLSTPPPGGVGACQVANGDERIAIRCRWAGDALDLEFLQFATRIHATRSANGALAGGWFPSHQSGLDAPIAFAATPVPALDPRTRFPQPAGARPAVDVTGTWETQHQSFGLGKGVFAQTPDGVVTGTLIPTDVGDLRYLAGNVVDHTLWLSTFDGQHAYVLRADVVAAGSAAATLTGVWTYSHILDDPFTGRRVASLDVGRLESLRLRAGATRVTIPQLAEPAFAGRPVIVDFSGTWCPACMDETPFLVELYAKFHARGLEILTVSLEATEDPGVNAKQVAYFREHFGIPWRIDILPGELTETEALLPPELENTGGFPITLFINRDGTVADLHSGFYGPAAPAEHAALKRRFEASVERILASPPPVAAPSPAPAR